MSIVLLSGCVNKRDTFKEELDCAYINTHYWNDVEKECKSRENTTGCIILKDFAEVRTINLPIDYKNININDRYEDDYVDIRVICNMDMVPIRNCTCEETTDEYGRQLSKSFYDIRIKRDKEIELCWD